MIIFVAFVAFFLPFIKPLGTGKEKIFNLPLEIMLVLAAGVLLAGTGMGYAMMYTNMYSLEQVGFPPIMGYEVSLKEVYNICLVGSFLGWTLAFFGEYIIIANIRNLLFDMKGYLKKSLLGKVFGMEILKVHIHLDR